MPTEIILRSTGCQASQRAKRKPTGSQLTRLARITTLPLGPASAASPQTQSTGPHIVPAAHVQPAGFRKLPSRGAAEHRTRLARGGLDGVHGPGARRARSGGCRHSSRTRAGTKSPRLGPTCASRKTLVRVQRPAPPPPFLLSFHPSLASRVSSSLARSPRLPPPSRVARRYAPPRLRCAVRPLIRGISQRVSGIVDTDIASQLGF